MLATAEMTLSNKDSRAFLAALGIDGEIVSTPSHSEDSITLVLDSGDCFVGDLEPMEYMDRLRGEFSLIERLEKGYELQPQGDTLRTRAGEKFLIIQ